MLPLAAPLPLGGLGRRLLGLLALLPAGALALALVLLGLTVLLLPLGLGLFPIWAMGRRLRRGASSCRGCWAGRFPRLGCSFSVKPSGTRTLLSLFFFSVTFVPPYFMISVLRSCTISRSTQMGEENF